MISFLKIKNEAELSKLGHSIEFLNSKAPMILYINSKININYSASNLITNVDIILFQELNNYENFLNLIDYFMVYQPKMTMIYPTKYKFKNSLQEIVSYSFNIYLNNNFIRLSILKKLNQFSSILK